MTEQRRCLRIHGHVQGVGFRRSLCAEARALGLAGWVRNRSDGSVEALFAGPPEAVRRLTAWSRQGPPAARVDRVDIDPESDIESETEGDDDRLPPYFEQRPTR